MKARVAALLLVALVGCGPDETYANCDEARQASAAPLHEGQPGYREALDRDGDGVACDG